jgi:hypothetical protein
MQVEALTAQLLDDLPGPRDALVLGPLAGRRDRSQVDPIPADMQVFRVLVHARHLDRRDQLDPQPLSGLRRLRHPGDRIVVRKRQGRHPGLRGFRDDPRGRKLPVGDRRMRLKLDQHRGGRLFRMRR